jgi:RimJ/RimL family protein N-acetyltransferase
MTDRQLVDFAGRCDPDRDIVVVLKRGPRIDGVCHLHIYRDALLQPVAELGISVDVDLRRAGWAASMLHKALRIARRRYVTRLVVHYLRRNLAMAALVRSLGLVSERWDEHGVTASLPVSAPQARAA